MYFCFSFLLWTFCIHGLNQVYVSHVHRFVNRKKSTQLQAWNYILPSLNETGDETSLHRLGLNKSLYEIMQIVLPVPLPREIFKFLKKHRNFGQCVYKEYSNITPQHLTYLNRNTHECSVRVILNTFWVTSELLARNK